MLERFPIALPPEAFEKKTAELLSKVDKILKEKGNIVESGFIKQIEEKNLVPSGAQEDDVYTEEEAEKIKKRLEDLGYL